MGADQSHSSNKKLHEKSSQIAEKEKPIKVESECEDDALCHFVSSSDHVPFSLLLFGDYDGPFRDFVWSYSVPKEEQVEKSLWQILIGLPFTPKIPFESGCVTRGRYIYIVGGLQEPPNSNYGLWHWKFWLNIREDMVITEACYKYDVHSERIDRIADLNQARKDHVVVEMSNLIYAIGGIDGSGRLLNTIEQYIPEINSWKILPCTLSEPRAGVAACAFNNKLHILGGRTEKSGVFEALSSCLTLDPNTGELLEYSPLPIETIHASATEFDQQLMVAGGINDFKQGMSLDDMEKTSKTWLYSFESEEWTAGPPLTTPKSRPSLIQIGLAVYCIGGLDTNGKASRSVELLFKGTSKWKVDQNLPIPVFGHRVALLNSNYLSYIDK